MIILHPKPDARVFGDPNPAKNFPSNCGTPRRSYTKFRNGRGI